MSAQCCMTQASVVQKVDNTIHWISLYSIGFPVDNATDTDLCIGQRYLMFEQSVPEAQ